MEEGFLREEWLKKEKCLLERFIRNNPSFWNSSIVYYSNKPCSIGYNFTMLPKQHRLSTSYEFNKTRKIGKSLRTPFFDIYYLELRNPQYPTRIGIVVTNRFSKSAPVRNRVKRVFREVFRLNLDKIKSGYWIVAHPKKLSEDKDYEAINAEFNKTLQKVPFAY